jgi:phage terminase small subunit
LGRARDPNRNKAFEIYQEHDGKIDLAEIASQLNISPGTVRGWKSKDSWDKKLNGTFQKSMERSKNKKVEEKKAAERDVEQVMKNPDLTDKQRLFCIYYSRCFNATKAYQKAYGCDEYAARTNGSRMMTFDNVRAEINRLKQSRLNRELLNEADIFQKYMDIAFADVTDFVEFGQEEENVIGTFGPVLVEDPATGKKVPLKQKVNVIRFKESGQVDGTLIAEVKNGKNGASIKLADRMKALDWLARHMNMATEEQKAKVEQIKAQTAAIKAKTQADDEEGIADDGFLEALKGTVAEDWSDEES